MFKIGQKVICVNVDFSPTNNLSPKGLKLNEIYTIESVNECKECGSEMVTLSEIPDSLLVKRCCFNCSKETLTNQFSSHRFRLLKYDIISNKSIIKSIIEERLDINIKNPNPKIDIDYTLFETL